MLRISFHQNSQTPWMMSDIFKLPVKKLSLNPPQLSFILQQQQVNVLNWPRGVGKSTITANKITTAMHPKYGMPRGKLAMVGQTLVQLLTRTLPSMIQGLEMLGIHRDDHYVIGKRPPSDWPTAFQAPISYDQAISFCTGLCVPLISLIGTSSRGMNVDEIITEETLLIDKEVFDSTINIANRGNLGKFPNYPFHHAKTFVTSMPYSLSGEWILEYGDYYKHLMYRKKKNELIELIIELLDCYDEDLHKRKELWEAIVSLKKELVYFASDEGVYYSEADIFDNLINLGWNYIVEQRRSLLDHVFRIEILGQLMLMQGAKFYPDLADKHLYDPSDTDHLLGLEYDLKAIANLKSLGDKKVIRHRPIDIGCDYGARFNCIVSGQQQINGKEFTVNGAFYRKNPHLISEVVDDLCEYFKDHGNHTVNYYYDHTALGKDGRSQHSYKDLVVQAFRNNKWNVVEKFIGHTLEPDKRYTFFCRFFREADPRLPAIVINREKAMDLYTAMQNTGIKETYQGFKKDKDAEKKDSVDQVKAPHLSDAFDTLLAGKYASKITGSQGGGFGNIWV